MATDDVHVGFTCVAYLSLSMDRHDVAAEEGKALEAELAALQAELDELRRRTAATWADVDQRGRAARRALDEVAAESQRTIEQMERDMLMKEHAIREAASDEAERIISEARREAALLMAATNDAMWAPTRNTNQRAS